MRWNPSILAVAVVLSSVGCSQSAGGPRQDAEGVQAQAAKPRSRSKPKFIDPRKGGLEVGFGEFAVSLEAQTVRPGNVTLVVHNGGRLVHGFEMEIEEVHSGPGSGEDDDFEWEAPTFRPGETIKLSSKLPPGVYKIECYVADHDDMGMETLLTVRRNAPLMRNKAATKDSVAISGFAFGPKTVTVERGTEVTWVNDDPTEHTVTAENGSFSSDPLAQGKTFANQFDRPGSYRYFCAIHPTMKGIVQVR
jgi:plastocyanin